MAVRGTCGLRKLEESALLQRAVCFDLRLAALIESPLYLQRKFVACEVFVCCIILPIQGKASRLIRSAGRLRQQSMRRRARVSHAPSQNQQDGKSALHKAR
jgi:hypothetical protein